MPIPQVLVTRYFQLLANRQFTEAEHELEIIKLSIHFAIPERELEAIRQFLVNSQFAEAEKELDKLKQLLSDKQFTIVEREWERFSRNINNKQFIEIKPNLDIIGKLLTDRQFTEATQELEKVKEFLTDNELSGANHELERVIRILANKQFIEASRDVNLLKQLLEKNQFAKIGREVERFKLKNQKTEWNRGYFRALYGMKLARQSNSNDSYAFFSHLDLSDKKALDTYRREFLTHVQNGLHGDFDRGYFSAWSDCMRILARLEIPSVNASSDKDSEKEKPLETLRSDKSQATMANFFQGKEA